MQATNGSMKIVVFVLSAFICVHRRPKWCSLLSALIASALAAQTPTATKEINEFNQGNYKAAKQLLTTAPNDPNARAYLAFTRAATGECTAATPELTKQFA